MSEEQIYEEARKRVKAKKDFYGHLTAWAIVNVILAELCNISASSIKFAGVLDTIGFL